jgi:sarcosine oxidase delta subunit
MFERVGAKKTEKGVALFMRAYGMCSAWPQRTGCGRHSEAPTDAITKAIQEAETWAKKSDPEQV